ncbi:MAG: class E sortase [Solirubrobacterales bacterium]
MSILRILSTALITAGLLLLADAGVTLAWQEPVSAFKGWQSQNAADDELDAIFAEFKTDKAPTRAQARRAADRFEKSARTGRAIGKIRIPEIGVEQVIVEGTGLKTLKRGPGRYPDTSFPGQPGTIGIAGHRTTYGAPFRNIDKLGERNRVLVDMPYGTFVYRYERQEIVPPTRTSVVDDVSFDRIVLTACHPLYSAEKRLVVFAKLEKIEAPQRQG